MENKQKVVYKSDKKLLKRVFIVILIIFLIVILYFPIKIGIELLYLNTWKNHDIKTYNFSFSLPRAYKDIEINTDDKYGITSSIFNTESSVEVNEEYVKKKPEIVYNGGNILNGISLMVQCLNTSKTTKTLDDIAESHHILVSINYEDEYEIGDLQKEYVEIMGSEGIKTIIDLENDEKEVRTLIAYLLPLEDKEITIMFMGLKENISKSMDEIEKIISKIK